jgi:hypothetical protein
MLADLAVAFGVVRDVAAEAEVTYALTSRQYAEVVGEILSRSGYAIDMADLPIVSAGSAEEVYLYAAKRLDLGSFLYVADAEAELSVGLILNMIGAVGDEPTPDTIFVTTWLVASGTDQYKKSAEWHLAREDYVKLKDWLAQRSASGDSAGI